jgi:hypothetical protein
MTRGTSAGLATGLPEVRDALQMQLPGPHRQAPETPFRTLPETAFLPMKQGVKPDAATPAGVPRGVLEFRAP